MIQVLILDDESELREEVADYLSARNFAVTEVGSIRQFHQFFPQKPYDILVLDRMLPDGDGLELVKGLRDQGMRCGIVMFSARDSSKDRIDGYELGADNYFTKPFRLDALCAAISSLARRVRSEAHWYLDTVNWTIEAPSGVLIKLTSQELALLLELSKQPQKVVSRSQIVASLGKDMASYDPRNLDALVLRLRKKVSEQSVEPLPLKTIHGSGYCLTHALLKKGS